MNKLYLFYYQERAFYRFNDPQGHCYNFDTVSLDPLSPEKEPNIDVNTPNGAGDNAIALAERHCGLESMISCRDSRLF